MENEQEIYTVNETVPITSPEQDRAALRAEIDTLEKQLEHAKRTLNCCYEVGMPSITKGMLEHSYWPVGAFLCIKLLCASNAPSIIAWIKGFLNIFDVSTLLALYLAVPMAGIIFALCVLSHNYYKEYKNEKDAAEAVVDYLQKELENKKRQYAEPNKVPDFHDNTYEDDYESRKAARERMIRALIKYRNYLNGTKSVYFLQELDESIRELGITQEEIESTKQSAGRRIALMKKEKNAEK